MEKWYQAIYLIGLFVPLITIFRIVSRSFTSFAVEIKFWWVGVLVVALTLLGIVFLKRNNNFGIIIESRLNREIVFIWKVFTLDWLFELAQLLKVQTKSVVNGISKLLEGEGGILWAIVLLLLVFSVLR